MKSPVNQCLLLSGLALVFTSCSQRIPKELDPFRIKRLSAEELHSVVVKNANRLDEVDKKYREKHSYSIYYNINGRYIDAWASPETMREWYKILLPKLEKSSTEENRDSALVVANDALAIAVRLNDREFARSLPPPSLVDGAREKFLEMSDSEFLSWMQNKISDETLPRNYELCEIYCNLMAAAAIVNKRYDLASEAYTMLAMRANRERRIYPISEIAWCCDKLGKIDDVSRNLILKEYDEIVSQKPGVGYWLDKRKNYIKSIVSKYNLQSSPRPSSQDKTPETNKQGLTNSQSRN